TDQAVTAATGELSRVVEPEAIVDVEAPLIGRDEELRAAAAHLERALAGEESLLVIAGESGSGKSRLLREIVEAAHRAYPDLVVGTGAASERPQLWIVDDAHDASPALLDAIEAATAGGQGRRLLCIVAGTTQLDAKRPRFGERAQYMLRLDVRPLEEADAMRLAAELPPPAGY